LAVSKNKIAEANKVGANSKELLAILTLLQEQEVKLGDVNNITEPANKSKSYLQEKPEQNADIEKIKEVGFD
ncbi:MAG: hypothetical protein LBO62_05725, partial [Endomicrobium sp.]|nr:hypothetical protein [Endomicrobium sp.]